MTVGRILTVGLPDKIKALSTLANELNLVSFYALEVIDLSIEPSG
jgi:hypothetical protein